MTGPPTATPEEGTQRRTSGSEARAVAAAQTPRQILLLANGNPLSHDAVRMAHELRGRIENLDSVSAEIVTAAFAGHAQQVAEHWAGEHPDGLIIAVGGDGTLNEIANGIMAATARTGARTALTAYPAGNANDQFRSWEWGETPIVDLVRMGATTPVDVLELSYVSIRTGEAGRRYALSYIAVGLLATAAAIVDERKRNALTNLLIVPRTLRRLRPVSVEIAGKHLTLDSLSWHIVSTMAKYLKVSSNARRADGLMEIVVVPHRAGLTWLRILWLAARAVVGLGKQEQRASVSFRWEAGGAVQLDGETIQISAGSDVVITCIPGALDMLSGTREAVP
jgi:diacylglycerol kinase family enzyme